MRWLSQGLVLIASMARCLCAWVCLLPVVILIRLLLRMTCVVPRMRGIASMADVIDAEATGVSMSVAIAAVVTTTFDHRCINWCIMAVLPLSGLLPCRLLLRCLIRM